MSKPAARQTDSVVHGGMIVTGDPTVFTNLLPTARAGDLVVCAKHGLASVAKVSTTVFIGTRGLARQDDACKCAGAVKLGPGAADAIELVRAAHALGWDEAQIKEALTEPGNFQYSGGKLEANGRFGRASVEGLPIAADGNLVSGPGGIGASGYARGSLVRGEAIANLGGGNGIGGRGGIGNAVAAGDVLLGSDGERVGLVLRGEAEVNAAEGEIVLEASGTVGGFVDALSRLPMFASIALGARTAAFFDRNVARALEQPMKGALAVGGDVGSLGGGAALEAYGDQRTGQGKFAAELDISAVLGASLKASATVGPDQSDAVPNLVTSGSGNVFVGG